MPVYCLIMYIEHGTRWAKDPHGAFAHSHTMLGMIVMYTSHGAFAHSHTMLGMIVMYTSHGAFAHSCATLVHSTGYEPCLHYCHTDWTLGKLELWTVTPMSEDSTTVLCSAYTGLPILTEDNFADWDMCNDSRNFLLFFPILLVPNSPSFIVTWWQQPSRDWTTLMSHDLSGSCQVLRPFRTTCHHHVNGKLLTVGTSP